MKKITELLAFFIYFSFAYLLYIVSFNNGDLMLKSIVIGFMFTLTIFTVMNVMLSKILKLATLISQTIVFGIWVVEFTSIFDINVNSMLMVDLLFILIVFVIQLGISVFLYFHSTSFHRSLDR